MNIDRSAHEFRPTEPEPGPAGRAWRGIKRWSGRHPRLSRVVWFAVALAILALLIWAIYPRPQRNLRFNQGPQPVGVAVVVSMVTVRLVEAVEVLPATSTAVAVSV